MNTPMRAIVKSRPAAGVDIRDDVGRVVDIGDNQIRVKVAAASICGTDSHLYQYTPAAAAFNMVLPVVLGHEGAGTVLEVGRGVDYIDVGDRVALDSHIVCFNCFPCSTGNAHLCENMRLLGLHTDGLFAEECVVDAAAAFVLPDRFPLDQAALLEPAGVAMHALQRYGKPVLGNRVLITGGGPVGLFIAEMARIAGAIKVVVVEPNPFRRNFAETLGAEAVEPGFDVPGYCRAASVDRGGFDVGFEASGHPSAFKTILDSLRVDGTYVSVGFAARASSLDTSEYLNRKSITLVGSFGRRLWDTWELIVSLVKSGALDLEKFISHRLPLAEFETAIELLKSDSCKIVLMPH